MKHYVPAYTHGYLGDIPEKEKQVSCQFGIQFVHTGSADAGFGTPVWYNRHSENANRHLGSYRR